MSLTREQADALPAVRTLEVDTTEEWGDTVYVRDLSPDDLDDLVEHEGKESGIAYMYRIASMCVCDAAGVQLFPDLAVMRKQSVAAVKKCSEAAFDFMGMTEEGQKEIAKNSDSTLSSSTGSE